MTDCDNAHQKALALSTAYTQWENAIVTGTIFGKWLLNYFIIGAWPSTSIYKMNIFISYRFSTFIHLPLHGEVEILGKIDWQKTHTAEES